MFDLFIDVGPCQLQCHTGTQPTDPRFLMLIPHPSSLILPSGCRHKSVNLHASTRVEPAASASRHWSLRGSRRSDRRLVDRSRHCRNRRHPQPHLKVILGVHELQSIWTVDLVYSRVNTPEPVAVSEHKPCATP